MMHTKNALLHYSATTLPLQKAAQKSKLNLENTKVSRTSANTMLNWQHYLHTYSKYLQKQFHLREETRNILLKLKSQQEKMTPLKKTKKMEQAFNKVLEHALQSCKFNTFLGPRNTKGFYVSFA